ncbi:MAG: O-antigen ligase family protein, partial [Acidobacteriales bacterium]|nr:O-antigen ligase family protein [Terriglobales bacterium]
PLLVTVGIVVFFRSPRVAVSLALLIPPIALLWGGRIIQSISDTEHYSSMTRLEAWIVLWPLIEKSPLVGLGPSHYYYYTENLPILGWYVKFSSHNQYMDLVAQYGFLGLAAFCWLVLEITSTALWLRPRVSTYFAHAYLIGAIAGIGGTIVSGMLADWIIPFYYNIGISGFRSSLLFWLFLGGVLALRRILINEFEREDEETGEICASCS